MSRVTKTNSVPLPVSLASNVSTWKWILWPKGTGLTYYDIAATPSQHPLTFKSIMKAGLSGMAQINFPVPLATLCMPLSKTP
jgi:hypothetical protein